MSFRGVVFAVSVGWLVTACGHEPPAQPPANRLAPGTIVWPSSLDHASTPATHRQAAVQLLSEAGVETAMVTMEEIVLRQQVELHPILKPYESVLREFFDKYISYNALRDDIAELYMGQFNELQLRQMIAFYQTPTGRLTVHELPKVLELATTLAKRKVEDHMSELKQMLSRKPPPPPPP